MKMNSKIWIANLFLLLPVFILANVFLFNLLEQNMFNITSRMPNVRLMNEEYRLNYVEKFIKHKAKEGVSYHIILGDSQFYGFEEVFFDTFPYLLEKKYGKKFLNLSIVDGRPVDAYNILLLLKKYKLDVKSILYGINLTHYADVQQGVVRLPDDGGKSILPFSSIKILFDFWQNYNSYVKAGSPYVEFNSKDFSPPTVEKYTGNISYGNDRYEVVDINLASLNKFLLELKTFEAKKVAVIIPHYREAVEFIGDMKVFQEGANKAESSVLSNSLEVLDLSFVLDDPSAFKDIVHLNKYGHQRFRTILNDRFYNFKLQ